jgi:ribosomal protein S18 acetylase RimI-like enzyme
MNITIRKARPKDAALLTELNADVQRHHAEAKPDLYKIPMPNDPALIAIYNERLQTEGNFLFIAELNNESVGYIHCQIGGREDNPFTVAFKVLIVNEVSVNASHRGQGIGEMLMNKAYELAGELGISQITLGVHAFNEDAIRFYKRLGFEITSIKMQKAL